jgi:hypothetical protein
MTRTLLVILLAVSIFSCKKSDDGGGGGNGNGDGNGNGNGDGIKAEDKAKADAMAEFLKENKFRLAKYYSETPIDYIDSDDVVKEETDLWQYVSTWLKDDAYSFNGTDVSIEQSVQKIPSDSSPVLTRHYAVQADKDGVSFDFLGHEYQDLNYRLIDFSDSVLKVSAQWNGKTVISEYNRVQ